MRRVKGWSKVIYKLLTSCVNHGKSNSTNTKAAKVCTPAAFDNRKTN
jgi:hypothetical protein